MPVLYLNVMWEEGTLTQPLMISQKDAGLKKHPIVNFGILSQMMTYRELAAIMTALAVTGFLLAFMAITLRVS